MAIVTTMILLTFRHGLRAAEVCDLRWDEVDFNGAVLHVRRVKNGIPSTHPLVGEELRALRPIARHAAIRGGPRCCRSVTERAICDCSE
jgi:integrase